MQSENNKFTVCLLSCYQTCSSVSKWSFKPPRLKRNANISPKKPKRTPPFIKIKSASLHWEVKGVRCPRSACVWAPRHLSQFGCLTFSLAAVPFLMSSFVATDLHGGGLSRGHGRAAEHGGVSSADLIKTHNHNHTLICAGPRSSSEVLILPAVVFYSARVRFRHFSD